MTFMARYDGACGSEDCTSGRIEAGDEVEYQDDELMHVGCAARARRGSLPPLCNACWIHHNGECA